jgi:hypothetical protein
MIKKWDEIKKIDWQFLPPCLLIGNGFSINIHSKFNYKSLFDETVKHNLFHYLATKEIFEKINTTNFEEVLRVIYHAYIINTYFYHAKQTEYLYLDAKNALIKSVGLSHVPYNNVPTSQIEKEFLNYSQIFTTNYDLIPYWSIMVDTNKYRDFFWSASNEFSITNTEIYTGKIPIYYLHGAIHIKTDTTGLTYKVSASVSQTINEIVGDKFDNSVPLFISEGKSDMKLRRIRENDYLNFCFNELLKVESDIVVFGHSLSEEYDNHILEALKKGKSNNIAISIFSGLKDTEKELFISRIKNSFSDSNKILSFFESVSHPLAGVVNP